MGGRIVVAGAGIIGLATAYEVARRGHRVTVLEPADRIAAQQTGHNSGVVHSGLWCPPGSLRAELGQRGAASMVRFAQIHGVPVEVCGKLVVASRSTEIPVLEELQRRGTAAGVPLQILTPAEARHFEPALNSVAALRVESTGIIDFPGVCAALVAEIERLGGEVRLGVSVRGLRRLMNGLRVTTNEGRLPAHRFVGCCGLQAERVARLGGVDPGLRVAPFRADYFELVPRQAHLVKGVIYPVPDPALPFPGIHLTRTIGGSVRAGAKAAPVRWSRLPQLGAKARLLDSLRRLVPELADDALRPAPPGVRAQAVRPDGTLVEDFLFVRGPHQLHVLNAPPPAATAALEIGRRIADELDLASL